jgi:hypothetical protein
MMKSLAYGMRRQCGYSLVGFDATLQAAKGYTPFWGIVRDLTAANRFRPTGLALKLLNEHCYTGDILHMTSLSAHSPDSSSEEALEIVTSSADLKMQGTTASFQLQPWGMAVLRPEGWGK